MDQIKISLSSINPSLHRFDTDQGCDKQMVIRDKQMVIRTPRWWLRRAVMCKYRPNHVFPQKSTF